MQWIFSQKGNRDSIISFRCCALIVLINYSIGKMISHASIIKKKDLFLKEIANCGTAHRPLADDLFRSAYDRRRRSPAVV